MPAGQVNSAKTHCLQQHEYTEENTSLYGELGQATAPVSYDGGNASTNIPPFPFLRFDGGDATGVTNPPIDGGNAWS